MRLLFSLAFRNSPVNLVLASDQSDAETLLKDAHPDLFLVDFHLQDKNGLEIAEEILVRNGRKIPIVLVTAEQPESLGEYLRLKRCVGYESKPISLATFAPNVLRYLVTGAYTAEPTPLSGSTWQQVQGLGINFAQSALAHIQRLKLCSDSELLSSGSLLQTAHNWVGTSGIGCLPKVAIESREIEKLVSLRDHDRVPDIRLLLEALETKFQQVVLHN